MAYLNLLFMKTADDFFSFHFIPFLPSTTLSRAQLCRHKAPSGALSAVLPRGQRAIPQHHIHFLLLQSMRVCHQRCQCKEP